MLRSSLLGVGILVTGLTVSLFLGQMKQGIDIIGTIGIVLLALAGIVSGSFVSGDRVRANYSLEEENKRRLSWSLNLTLMGLPALAAALAYYVYKG